VERYRRAGASTMRPLSWKMRGNTKRQVEAPMRRSGSTRAEGSAHSATWRPTTR